MNFFHRIGLCAVVLGAVGCDKDDPEIVEPVAEPETVIIGCAGATGADVDVRTQLVEDGRVYWEKSDEIRLWARESGAGEFLTGVQNVPFQFHYYSPSWSRVGFKGTINEVETTFDATKKYDYFAVSPAPADGAVSGTRVTYPIPAEQTGEYDGRCDILTAELKDAPALKAGDDNPSVNLKFNHHIHLLKFTIKSSAWEENRPIRAVELTFPSKVVGQLTVDATDPAVNELAPVGEGENAGKKVLIKFPAGKERKAGDTFIAMIAPTTIGSGETIGMRIIGTLGETSAEIPAAGKSFAGGHTTPVDLNVKAMNNLYKTVTLTFNVSDGKGGIGENTLGERVNTVRVIGVNGAFSNPLEKSERCSVSEDGTTLEYTVPSTGGNGVYSLTFLSKKLNPGYLWPDELWNDDLVSGKTLKVEYESANAWIRTIDGYSTVQTMIAAFNGSNESVNTLSIPYLFEENFDNVADYTTDKGTAITNPKTEPFEIQGLSSGWYGSLLDAKAKTGVYLVSYLASASLTHEPEGGENQLGRLDSPFLMWLKDAKSKNIVVSFDYGGNTTSWKYGWAWDRQTAIMYAKLTFGTDTRDGGIKGTGNPIKNVVFTSGNLANGDFDHMQRKEQEVSSVTNKHRLSWRSSFSVTGNGTETRRMVNVYIDNIKVQLK